MSTAPLDLLNNAKLIRANQADEAAHRAAISRAYYAAYHAARGFHISLPSPGRLIRANGRHEQLVEQLQNPTIATTDARHIKSRRIGFILRDLLRQRITADYFLAATILEDDADEVLLNSESVLNLIP